jgi:hypothetical protein
MNLPNAKPHTTDVECMALDPVVQSAAQIYATGILTFKDKDFFL